MARGDGFFSVIKRMGEESRKERDDWNENNPPLEEFSFVGDDGEEHTVGIWIGADGILSFSFKMPNGKYNPYTMIRIPHAVYNFILKQEAIK